MVSEGIGHFESLSGMPDIKYSQPASQPDEVVLRRRDSAFQQEESFINITDGGFKTQKKKKKNSKLRKNLKLKNIKAMIFFSISLFSVDPVFMKTTLQSIYLTIFSDIF